MKQLTHGGSFLFGSHVKADKPSGRQGLRRGQATKWRCPVSHVPKNLPVHITFRGQAKFDDAGAAQLREMLDQLPPFRFESLDLAGTSVTPDGLLQFDGLSPQKLSVTYLNTIEPHEKLRIASQTPREYELAFSLKRQSGNEGALLVHIPVADQRATIVFAGYQKTRSGISLIDGAEAFNNETTTELDPFIDNQLHRVVIRVTEESVFASVDDMKLVDWKGDLVSLSAPSWADKTGLYIVSGQETRFEVSDVSLKDLTAGGVVLPDLSRSNASEGLSDIISDADDPYARDRKIAKRILAIGGTPKGPVDIDQDDFKISSVDLAGLSLIPRADLAALSTLPALKMLNVRGSSINSEEFSEVLKCPFLHVADLHGTSLTSTDFRKLSQLPHLQRLHISADQVTDQWQFLADLSVLTSLQVMGDNLPVIEKLGDFSNLRTFYLQSDSVDAEQIDRLVNKNPNLIVTWRHSTGQEIFGGSGVRPAAKQLSEKGWALSGNFIPSSDPWNPTIDGAWDESRPFKVTIVRAPENHTLSQQDIDLLDCFDHFYRLELPNVSNLAILPELLARHNHDFCDLRGSSLNDETLVRIGRLKPISSLRIDDTRVSRLGVKAFKELQPKCDVTSSHGQFPYEHRFGL